MVLVFALPLNFHGRLRVLRSMFIPGALHGIEASFLAGTSMRKLRAAIFGVVWSRRQPFANVCAVLSLLDGPSGCNPAYCVVWFRLRLLRRYPAYRPGEVSRVYRLLESAAEGCPCHGPAHLLIQSAAEIGFRWDLEELAWDRPGLPLLSNLSGPVQHFRAAILGAWRKKVSANLCARKGFCGVPGWILMAPCSYLTLTMFEREIKRCFEVSLLVVSGMGFFLGRFRVRMCLVGSVGVVIMTVTFFSDCTFPPPVEIREHPELHDLMEMDKTSWSRCLLWHGWLPLLSGVNGGSPWALTPAEGAVNLLACALGWYSSSPLADWRLPLDFDIEGASRRVAEEPDVWTDGSLVDDRMSGTSSAGAGCFAYRVSRLWTSWRWGN